MFAHARTRSRTIRRRERTAVNLEAGQGRKPSRWFRGLNLVTVSTFGSDWGSRLVEICGALDEQKVPVPPSAKWKNCGCGDWTDVLSEDQEGLAKALQYRLDWVAEHPTSEPGHPRGK